MNKAIRLIIVDDEALVRERFKYAFPLKEHGYEIVGEAEDGEEALELCLRTGADIVITDIVMPGMDGLELTKQLKLSMPQVKVIILSNYQEFEFARKAMSFGALGYLLKVSSGHQELLGLLEQARQEIEADREKLLEEIDRRSQFQQNVPLLRKQFIQDLVNGLSGSWPDTLKKFAYLGMPSPSFGLTAGIVQMDRFEQVTRTFHVKDVALLQYALMRMLEELAESKVALSAFPWMEGQLALLIHWNSSEQLVHQDMILDSLFRSYKDNVQKYLPFTISVSFSSAKRPLQVASTSTGWGSALKEAFEEGEAALPNRFYSGSGSMQRFGKKSRGLQPLTREMAEQFHEVLLSLSSFTGPGLAAEAIRDQIVRPLAEHRINPGDVRAWLHRITEDYAKTDPAGKEHCIAELKLVDTVDDVESYLEFLTAWSSQSRMMLEHGHTYRDEIQKAIDYIASHYREQLSISTVCEYIHVTPNYFSHLFKKETGMNFTDYVTQYRIRQAKRLLQETTLQVQEIADKVGIADYKYFARLFRRSAGVTPREYRENSASSG